MTKTLNLATMNVAGFAEELKLRLVEVAKVNQPLRTVLDGVVRYIKATDPGAQKLISFLMEVDAVESNITDEELVIVNAAREYTRDKLISHYKAAKYQEAADLAVTVFGDEVMNYALTAIAKKLRKMRVMAN